MKKMKGMIFQALRHSDYQRYAKRKRLHLILSETIM